MKDKVFWGTLTILIVTIVPILLLKPDYSSRFRNSQKINIGIWYSTIPNDSTFIKLYRETNSYFVNCSDSLIKQCHLYIISSPKDHMDIDSCNIAKFPQLNIGSSVYVCEGFKSCKKEQYNSTLILMPKDSLLYIYSNEHDKYIFEQTLIYSVQSNK